MATFVGCSSRPHSYSIKLKEILFVCCLLTSLISIGQETGSATKYKKSNSRQLFDGLYFGITGGSQNIFGGALIDNLDLLGQKSGLVVEFLSGYRKQFKNSRFLLGAEAHFGLTDGNLVETDPRYLFDVNYKNNTQYGFGINGGFILGKNKNFLLYSYAHVINRKFDVEFITTNGILNTQKDGQGFIRYGLGVEVNLIKKFNARASFGKLNVDFGDLIISQDVEDKFDFNLGIIYQL